MMSALRKYTLRSDFFFFVLFLIARFTRFKKFNFKANAAANAKTNKVVVGRGSWVVALVVGARRCACQRENNTYITLNAVPFFAFSPLVSLIVSPSPPPSQRPTIAMRLSVVAIAASLAVVTSAESAYFPFPPEGACVAACTDVSLIFSFPRLHQTHLCSTLAQLYSHLFSSILTSNVSSLVHRPPFLSIACRKDSLR